MIRLMVADDHLATRQQAVKVLPLEGVIQVIAEAETSDETFKIASKLLPDIVLLDTHMPGLIGTPDLVKRLASLRGGKVIIFAGEAKAADVHDLLESGASGYVLKTDAPALIRMAILMVSRGRKDVISPSVPRHVTRLSTQERSILRQLTQRGRLPKIAERMGITEEELESTLNHLAGKLELAGTAQVVKWAKKHGF